MENLRLTLLFSSVSLFRPLLSAPVTQTEPSYIPEPSHRGTFGLLWSCLVTFGLCVWTTVHLPFMPLEGSRNRFYYKLVVATGAIIVPEVVLGFAVAERIRARKVLKAWQDTWSDEPEYKTWLKMPGAFFVVMGGFMLEVGKNTNTDDLVTTIHPWGFERLLQKKELFKKLLEDGILTKAHFSCRSINAKSKASGITKLLAIVQIMWMVVQCIGRKISGLPITLLEAHVLIQILYAVVAYVCWWEKPLDIEEPILLRLDEDLLKALGYKAGEESTEFFLTPYFTTEKRDRGGIVRMIARAWEDCFAICGAKEEGWIGAAAIVNGALHATVWNSHFPTSLELFLWRISALGLGALPLVVFLGSWKANITPYGVRELHKLKFKKGYMPFLAMQAIANTFWWPRRGIKVKIKPDEDLVKDLTPDLPTWSQYLICWLSLLNTCAYMLSILYLTVEAFISMRSLPAGAYSTHSWSNIFPHF